VFGVLWKFLQDSLECGASVGRGASVSGVWLWASVLLGSVGCGASVLLLGCSWAWSECWVFGFGRCSVVFRLCEGLFLVLGYIAS
jgi:hypothetical protein